MLRRSISLPTDPCRMLTYCNMQVTHRNLLLFSSLSAFVRCCSACGGRCSEASVLRRWGVSVTGVVTVQYHLFVMFTFEDQTEPVSGCWTLHESQCTVGFLSMDSQHAAVFWQACKRPVMSSWCQFDIPTSERSLEVFWPSRKLGLWNDSYLAYCYSPCHCWFELMHVRPEQVSSSGVLILRLLICVFIKKQLFIWFLVGLKLVKLRCSFASLFVSPHCSNIRFCACVPTYM